MSQTTDPFQAFSAGFDRCLARELAGQPVPVAWEKRLDELDRQCREIEDARRAAKAAQPELFGGRRQWGI